MESRKIVLMNLFARQQWRCRHREQTYRHRGRERKERVGQMERVTWKHIRYICKIYNQWEFAVSLSELKPGLSNQLQKWIVWEKGGSL